MTLLFNRRERGGDLFANPPRRAHPSPRCCRNVSSLLCLWYLFTPLGCLKASGHISSSPLQIGQTMGRKLPNPQTHKRRGFKNLGRSVSEAQQACSRQHTTFFPLLCSINYTVVMDVNRSKTLTEDPTENFLHNFLALYILHKHKSTLL